MPGRAGGTQHGAMTDTTESAAQQRDRANRFKYATRRLIRDMDAGERDLERRTHAFDAAVDGAKRTIERDSPVAHGGLGPEPPWAWRAATDDGASAPAPAG
jgi:hypothetical protein